MSDKTAIEWCDATFNPWWGCTRISPACDHCYAATLSKRYGHDVWDNGKYRTFGQLHWNGPIAWARTMPAKLGRRPRVFCASMADVFDKDAPAATRLRLWNLIDDTPELDWLLLTKRIGNAAKMLPRGGALCWPHVWIGATIANQEEADRDIPKLLALPAHIRFLSCEPLLGAIDLHEALYVGEEGGPEYVGSKRQMVHWVIAGGESGPKARPSHPDWHRSLRDQCAAAGVPFLFKQWGEWTDYSHAGSSGWELTRTDEDLTRYGRLLDGPLGGKIVQTRYPWDDRTYPCMVRVGKKAAGRELDGRTHDGFPI